MFVVISSRGGDWWVIHRLFLYLQNLYSYTCLWFSFQMSQNPNKSKCLPCFWPLKLVKHWARTRPAPQVRAQHQRTEDPRRRESRLWREWTVDGREITTLLLHLLRLSATGHPQEASGEGPVWAAVSDRSSLHPEEEGGRGAHRPRQQNRESPTFKRDLHLLEYQKSGFGGNTRDSTLEGFSPLETRWIWQFLKTSPNSLSPSRLQEKRRAERAEQQRVRAEREKERQARLAVGSERVEPPGPRDGRFSPVWRPRAPCRRRRSARSWRSSARSWMMTPRRRRSSPTWPSSTALPKRSEL